MLTGTLPDAAAPLLPPPPPLSWLVRLVATDASLSRLTPQTGWRPQQLRLYPASKCVDGDLNNFCHSDVGESSPSLTLDLGTVKPIAYVAVYNRAGQLSRLGEYTISYRLSSSGPWTICSFETAAADALGPLVSRCLQLARYVRVQLPGDNRILNLAEVEVYSRHYSFPLPSAYGDPNAWYCSGAFDVASSTWQDCSGNGNTATLSGSGLAEVRSAGHGAASEVLALSGTTSSVISFGAVIQSEFTLCSVTRYTGGAKQRILNGDANSDWCHGHWSGLAGVAYYDRWKTASQGSVSPDTNWWSCVEPMQGRSCW